MSFAVMSFYKYISKRLCDQSFILYIQKKNIWKCIEVLALGTSLPPCCLRCLKIRRIFNCKVFTACNNERNIFEVLLNCTHINNEIAN